jgi:hypothetical protein
MQHHRPAHVVGLQLVAVELRLEQEGGEVVARLGEVFLDARVDVLVELAAVDLRLPFLGRHVDVLEDHADEPPEDVGVLLREAEHLDDHAQRDVLCVVDRRVDHVLPRRRVEQLVAQFARERCQRSDRLRCERREQQPPCERVERRVRRDRRRDADRRGEVVGPGPHLAHHDRPRREVLGVVRDRGDAVVRHRQPRAAVPIGVRDGARRAQVVPDGVGVADPLGIGVVEVLRPVGDGWPVSSHDARSSSIVIANSGQFAAASRACSSSSGGTTPSCSSCA